MKKISTLGGVVIILVMAFIAFGGVFAYEYLVVKTQLITEPQKNAIQNSNSQTASWETYTDNQYGVEVKYPQKVGSSSGELFSSVDITEPKDVDSSGCFVSSDSVSTSHITINGDDFCLAKIENEKVNPSGTNWQFISQYVYTTSHNGIYVRLTYNVDTLNACGSGDQDCSGFLKTIQDSIDTLKFIPTAEFQTYQDNQHGFEFKYPPTWSITSNNGNEIVLTQKSGEWVGDWITIDYISGNKISDSDAKFGDVSYFYDNNTNKWMMTGNQDSPDGINGTQIARPISYTIDGFPVFGGTTRWETYIIPLSQNTFLRLNITGSGQTKPLDDLLGSLKLIKQ